MPDIISGNPDCLVFYFVFIFISTVLGFIKMVAIYVQILIPNLKHLNLNYKGQKRKRKFWKGLN